MKQLTSLLGVVIAAVASTSLRADTLDPSFEVISNYQAYIAGNDNVAVWYGRRVALVLDDEPDPRARDSATMHSIVATLDDIFDAFDRITARRPKLTAPLHGKIRIEVSSKVGGGLAHHGKLGIAVGNGFFDGLYKRFRRGQRTVDQVFFYEIARNYWMADMNPAIDYHTSKGPQDYGWWTVGFNNAMSVFLPAEIDSIDDMYYFGSDGKRFSDGMESNLDTYLSHAEKYNWDNSWNVPLVPWKKRTSINDLMTGLLIRLHRDHGGAEFITRLYEEIPKRKALSSRSDRQGARDNFFEACCLAANKDLSSFFDTELRWEISDDCYTRVRKSLQINTPTCAEGEPAEAHRWQLAELQFTALEASPNPCEVKFDVNFQHESGSEISVPGFFDGDRKYVVRFCPPLAGRWTYESTSDTRGLDDQTGHLAVLDDGNHRGGIIIDPDSDRRFRYQNGNSYYPIAFESDWLFALDAENSDDIPATRKFVDSLAENGFNQVVMNVFAYDVNWGKDKRLDPRYEYGSPDVFPFAGNNETPDHSRLNVEYFQRLDRVIEYLNEKNIAAHLMIYVWNKRVNWPKAGSAADNRYFDYVVKRYQAYPNLIWDISKEALGYGHNDVNYITGRIKRLRELDAYDRLITVHDYGYCRRFTRMVDFVSVQLWNSELYGVMKKVRSDMPGKPILNIEHGGYERGPYVVFNGNYTSPETCLERAWQCVFAGTYPTHYWQGAAWNVVVPDINELPEEDRPRLHYYRHMQSFIDRFDVNSLKAGDKKSNAGFALHNGKDLYIYYVPKECEFIGLRLPSELRGKTMSGTWFNPYDGSYSDPVRKKIVQWPAYEVPRGDGFRLLVLRVEE